MYGKSPLPLIVAVEVRTFEDIGSSDKKIEKRQLKNMCLQFLKMIGIKNNQKLLDYEMEEMPNGYYIQFSYSNREK